MAAQFLERVLREPSYGWTRDGKFYRPTNAEIMREWFSRINIFKNGARGWLQFTTVLQTFCLMPFAVVFLAKYFSWKLMAAGFLYSMVWLGTHGTIWLHRYSTHRAYTFRNDFARWVCANLSVKIVPEEVYVISHHVHHAYTEQPGDPYNVHGGGLYCFLAGELHQPINPDLSEKDYARLCMLMTHTGVKLNTYEQYKKYGSMAHPARVYAHWALNWAAWYGIFYLIGGHALATALFGWSAVWAVGIRTYNYDGHGAGKDKRGATDFDRSNLAINQAWAGYVAGEWHNNHHLFPNGVRSGFLPWQMDTAWMFIWFYRQIGGVSSWRDYKDKFYAKHYLPYLAAKNAAAGGGQSASGAQAEPAPAVAPTQR